ncbi:MAG: glycosyltransferase [Flavobacterium sp.]|nr:glycosyltransferase [Flavobacterium sp.]
MLSILIPTYNYSVIELVQNLHQQCIACSITFEIICLDDKSAPVFQIETQKVKELTNCYYYTNELNLGRTKTRQLLAEMATFDWVLFLDADVLPEDERFIKRYIAELNNKQTMVFGGYKYKENQPKSYQILRYTYGKDREEKPASFRNKKPYQFVFSGNMLIQKKIFLELNYAENEKFYGMDIYFAYQLYVKKIPIHHIDNAIYHLGLEPNEVFFEKSLQSVVSRKHLLENKKAIEKLNPLLSYYFLIKKFRLLFIARFIFKISEQLLKKNILSEKPNLFLFDLYRLGYICSIK